jgi:hypothetical protein
MKTPATLLCAVLTLCLAGCFDSDEEFTLNPDGSGKVKIKAVSVPKPFQFGNPTPEQMLKDAVTETLKKSEGIDAWTDVTANLKDDGNTIFSGTAYFKDISKVKLNILGTSSDFPSFEIKKGADGGMILQGAPKKVEDAEPPPANEPKPTEEEIQKILKTERMKMQGGRRIMEGFLKDLRMKARVVLPGTLAESKNFKKVADNAVEITLDGATVLKTLDALIADDAFMRKQLEGKHELAKSGPPMDDTVMEKLFGEKGPLRATVKGPLKAAFDYEAEAAPARKNMPEIFQKFGVPAPLPPPTAGAGFKKLRIAGAKMIHEADNERGVSPLNESEPGLSFAIIGDFGGSVLSVKEGLLTKAVSDSGENLLPKEEFHRQISFPRLTNDRASVVLDVRLQKPGPKATGVKEISGKIQYVVGKTIKEVDLGFAEFAKGAAGKALGAEIQELGDAQFQEGHQELTLKLDTQKEAVTKVLFYDAAGKELETVFPEDTFGGDAVFRISLKGKFPAKGKAVAKVYQDLQVYEIPFTVTDVDLLGRPQKK